jgi:hypothetical protein
MNSVDADRNSEEQLLVISYSTQTGQNAALPFLLPASGHSSEERGSLVILRDHSVIAVVVTH